MLALALLLVAPAASAIVTVGPDSGPTGCRFRTIQEAIKNVLDHERTGSADPYIAVAGGFVYPEALDLDGSNIGSYTVFGSPFDHPFVQIYGDYDAICGRENSNVMPAQIGTADTHGSVLFIHGNKSVEMILNHLSLGNANNTSGNATGGGINFTGAGKLDVYNTTIYNNQAAFGGGIFANGLVAGIQLTLHAGTIIENNFARNAGGGIRLEGVTHLFALESPTWIEDNTANPASSDGTGGGLQLYGSQTVADVGSAGYFGSGVIYFNHARNGGGISIGGGGIVRLFPSVAGQPPRIEYNDATQGGGGAWLDADYRTQLCGYGYAIDNNTSSDGAAIYDSNGKFPDGEDSGGTAYFTEGTLTPDANGNICGTTALLPDHAQCTQGAVCNTMNHNTATQDDGAVVTISAGGNFRADELEISGNTAGRVFRLSGNANGQYNTLIADNVLRHEVARIDTSWDFHDITVAGNVLGSSSPAFSVSCCKFQLFSAIVWQPGNAILDQQPATLIFDNVISNDTASQFRFDQYDNVNGFDPLFVAPANGDYRLTPLSPAIGYASSFDTHTTAFDILNQYRCHLGPQTCDVGVFAFLGNEAIRAEIAELQALYQSTNGPNWTNHTGWNLFSVDPCTSWFGISCNADHTHITQIFLPANHLVGSLPADFFSFFPQLNYFDVAFNELTGALPPLDSLPFIHFRINNNRFSGPLPAAPPIPPSYTNADFNLCPNNLVITSNATWDTLVSFGQYPWWRDCDGIFGNGFGN